jgi:Protein of unknown function (DUF4238)
VSDPRHHHWLSECYLRGFAVLRKKGKHQIQVFDRVQRGHFPTSTRNVAGERDFNRLDEDQGDDPYALEKAYAAFEGRLAPAIQRVAQAGAFTSQEDRDLIISMIALFALRNPRWREQVRAIHEDMSLKMMEAALATKERWEGQIARMQGDGDRIGASVTYEEMKEFIDSRKFKIGLNRGYQIGNELSTFDGILPHLGRRKWWFVRAHRSSGGFVTGDHPVALMWADPSMRGRIFHSPGFALRGTQVTFPLTFRVAMLGAFELKEQTNEFGDPFIAQINGTTIGFSARQVYARDLNFTYMLTAEGGVRKASKLLSDRDFLGGREKSEDEVG